MKHMSLTLCAVALALAVAGSASARREAASCNLVRPSVIHNVLGVTVGPLTSHARAGVLTCAYSVNGVPNVVQISFASNVSAAAFHATQVSFTHAYPNAHAVHGLGDAAFAAGQGAGLFAETLLFAHKGHSQVTVTATASLAKCEHLARLLLPHA